MTTALAATQTVPLVASPKCPTAGHWLAHFCPQSPPGQIPPLAWPSDLLRSGHPTLEQTPRRRDTAPISRIHRLIYRLAHQFPDHSRHVVHVNILHSCVVSAGSCGKGVGQRPGVGEIGFDIAVHCSLGCAGIGATTLRQVLHRMQHNVHVYTLL